MSDDLRNGQAFVSTPTRATRKTSLSGRLLSRLSSAWRNRIASIIAKPSRLGAVMLLDGLAVIFCFAVVSLILGDPLENSKLGSVISLFAFGGFATMMFFLLGAYRRTWRFMSLEDCFHVSATSVAGLAATWMVTLGFSRGVWNLGSTLIPFLIMHGSLVLISMAGMRVARRALHEFRRSRIKGRNPSDREVILYGEMDWARAILGLMRTDDSKPRVVGIITPCAEDRGTSIPGIRFIGAPGDLPKIVEQLRLHGHSPSSIILRGDGASMPRPDFLRLVACADKLDLGLAKARAPWSGAGTGQVELEKFPLGDLLGRPEMKMDPSYINRLITGRRILVTGAGGTIGGELVRQLATFGPSEIVLLDHSEFALYSIDMEVREKYPDLPVHPELCSIRQKDALRQVFRRHEPEIVFHAAALKHVPMVEANPSAGAHTNIIGTRNVADVVCEFGAKAMIQVSTDKAVNPVGLMGATKRLGELYCQALDLIGSWDPESPRFMTVRFGNVLGSSGSLVPLFEKQLAAGKPLTVTHPDITRYFMTVQEAVQLILQSSSRALETQIERGAIFVLDMGEPVKIVDIAKRVIRMAGLAPDVDVPIKFVGLRPGEKLYEELFDTSEERSESSIPGVFEARPSSLPLPQLVDGFRKIEGCIKQDDADGIREVTDALIKASAQGSWSKTIDALSEAAEPANDPAYLEENDATVEIGPESKVNGAAHKTNEAAKSNVLEAHFGARALLKSSSGIGSLSRPAILQMPINRAVLDTGGLVTETKPAWPHHEADEVEAASAVLRSGRVNSLVHGDNCRAFEQEFARYCGAPHAISVSNGTVALELALRALDVGPGDEVIVPARSFFASAACVVAAGATPVIADIEPDSQNICVASARTQITSRTKAIICVHLAGRPCDMDGLLELCEEQDLFLIEDCAQAHGAAIGERRVGSFGHAAAFSFCTDKIMSTGGEGGMLLLHDEAHWAKAWAYKDHGKDPAKALKPMQGSAFRYVHDSFGSNFRMTEFQAAIGRLQLAKLPRWLEHRRSNAARLDSLLRQHPFVTLPKVPENVSHAYYKYYFFLNTDLLDPGQSTTDVIAALKEAGVTAAGGSCPDMSKEAAFAAHGGLKQGGNPIAESVGTRTVMLPVDHLLTGEDMNRTAAAIRRVLDQFVQIKQEVAQ